MLSLESQVIDATTEEGQQMLHEIEEQEKRAKEGGSGTDTTTKGKQREEDLAAEVD